jgi:hypothetical protein
MNLLMKLSRHGRRSLVCVTEYSLQGHLLPHDLQIDTETWVTVIEQFLMLILIIGRWMLPKGDAFSHSKQSVTV